MCRPAAEAVECHIKFLQRKIRLQRSLLSKFFDHLFTLRQSQRTALIDVKFNVKQVGQL